MNTRTPKRREAKQAIQECRRQEVIGQDLRDVPRGAVLVLRVTADGRWVVLHASASIENRHSKGVLRSAFVQDEDSMATIATFPAPRR